MATLQEQDVFDKKFVRRVAMMIESELIGYSHVQPWVEKIIIELDIHPDWIVDILAVKDRQSVVQIACDFVSSEPAEALYSKVYIDEYLACLFLRYTRGELSWATFLKESGEFTDPMNGHRFCEAFYRSLNTLEENEFSKLVEQSQREEFEREYAEAIASVQPLYQGFVEYFRRNRKPS